jgi:hypothetical protein
MPIPKLKLIESNSISLDFEQLKKDLYIDTDFQYEHPPICIEIVQQGHFYRFGTFGNFSVVGGKGKARKGYFVSAITGAAINNQKVLCFKTRFENKDIVYFDTEQSDYDLSNAVKRSVRLNQLSKHPDNLKVFALRQLSTEDRVYFIEQYFEKHKNIGLVIIDGVRDLIIDINNPNQATELTTKIMQWTKIYNFHLVAVLHENPGSDKLRGHIGTELTNKAETVVSIEIPKENKEISVVMSKFARGTKPFEQFAFQVNENDLPELTIYEAEF